MRARAFEGMLMGAMNAPRCPLLIVLWAVLLSAGLGISPAAARRAVPAPAIPARTVSAPQAAVWDTVGQLEAHFRWAESESLGRVIFARVEPTAGSDSLEYSRALLTIGTARLKRGLFADGQAYDALERGMAIRARHSRVGDPVLERAHVVAAVLYPDGGRVEEARAHGEEALRLLAAAPVLDTLTAAQAHMALGVAHSRLGHTSEARAAFDRALALREAKLGSNHPQLVPTLAQYGEFLSRVGEFDAARELLMHAVRNCAAETLAAGDYLEGCVARLSTLEHNAGNLAESVDLAERAYELTRQRTGDASLETARRRIVLGYRLGNFGDHDGAVSYLTRAMPVMDAKAGAANPQTINARLELINQFLAVSDTVGAARELGNVAAAMQRQEAFANDNLAGFRAMRAHFEDVRGHAAAARETLLAAIQLERKRHDPLGSGLGTLVFEELSLVRGPSEAAYLERARADWTWLRDSTQARASSDWDELLDALALADARGGSSALAWDEALRAESAARRRLTYSLEALPDRQALQLAQQLGSPCDLLVRLAERDRPSDLAAAWDRVVRWRGLVRHEIARRRLPPSGASDTALVAAHQQWVAAQHSLAQLVVSGAAHPDDPGTAARFETAHQAADDAERRYIRASRGRVAPDDSVSLARVLARLAPDQALVAFASEGDGGPDPGLGAFVASGRDPTVRFVRLGSAAALDDRIGGWTRALAAPPATAGAARAGERASRALGAEVRKAVWDPIAKSLGGAHDVWIVPEGSVLELPWLALPAAGGHYLVEEPFTLHVINAERDLLPAADTGVGRGLLAVGGPDFDADAGAAAHPSAIVAALRARSWPCVGGPIGLERLPGARAEAEDIARRWPADAGPVDLLVAGAADEATFKRDAPGHRVIHVATHGVMVADTCAERAASGTRGVGGVALLAAAHPRHTQSAAAPASGAAVEAPTPPRTTSPWLGRQVWLALAGANRPPSPTGDENEGLLTAEEVTTLDLRGTDWVVLSACQSGLAAPWPREGVLGMRRAFQLAGARAVIASQWPVADDATREWMNALYEARARGLTAGPALCEASRTVLTARRRQGRPTAPFYWAAFTASGE
ncbi:MAG TPA: CHAT domain-containing tetratricopeptide repeat protein [Candidatus Saccharimonadaceae bacterium]|nr:CHAT domain-containing tetratricopeptide repeat protein [Candidatus Saccharimonadaceae bacterium]